VMNLNVQRIKQSCYYLKLQSVWAYYLRYLLQVQLVLFTLFVAVRLSRLVLTLCNLEQYEVDTISGDMVKTLHVIVGFVKRIKIFLMTFQLVVVSRFAQRLCL
jgi:hypothetical protein